jgi:hypothetical protein
MKIAQRAKVKLSIEDYKKRSKEKTKAGNEMSRMAHMELAIRDKISVNLGDVIYYVNNGIKASHGDVQKVNKPKKGWSQEQLDSYFNGYGVYPSDSMTSIIQLNCYRINPSDLENNPEMTGEYNVARAITTFNKRIEPLLVVFKQEVRDGLLIDNPEDRMFFTKDQSELINGLPFEDGDQDKLEEVLTISEPELEYWKKRGLHPDYMYELALEGWEEKLIEFQSIRGDYIPETVNE